VLNLVLLKFFARLEIFGIIHKLERAGVVHVQLILRLLLPLDVGMPEQQVALPLGLTVLHQETPGVLSAAKEIS
jgi:hypothetical protein